MKKYTILLLILISMTQNIKAQIFACDETACNGKVAKIFITSKYIEIEQLNPMGTTVDVCLKVSHLTNDHIMFDEIYSLLLSAKLAEKSVKIIRNNPIWPACKVSEVEFY